MGLGEQLKGTYTNCIDGVKSLFDEEHRVRFKNPLDGETKEYPLIVWGMITIFLKQRYIKKGWIRVDARGVKIPLE